MSRLSVLLFSVVTFLILANRSAAEEHPPAGTDLTGFPRLEGTVVQVLGHLNSYIPPTVGDRFSLDLSTATSLTDLSFEKAKPGEGNNPYIPLGFTRDGVNPLAVESIKRFTNGAFHQMQLISRSSTEGSPGVKVDIQPLPGVGGPDYVRVWITVESDVVHGVVLIDARVQGKFPNQKQ